MAVIAAPAFSLNAGVDLVSGDSVAMVMIL